VLSTRFTQLLDCPVPIQLAGMGGFADPELPAAVANAGGLGMIGGVMVPPHVLAETLDSLGQRTSGPYGVNFLMPFLDRECVEVAAEKARLVEFFYDHPDRSLVDAVHSAGALAAWQVGSMDEARAAEHSGCDLVIAQGIEAGGHVRGQVGLLALLGEVREAVQIPVVAAGGIGTARAMAGALAAGADAVRVGTRFVAATESHAHPQWVRGLIDSRPEDTVLTEAFSVMWPNAPHRVLRSCVEAAQAFEGEVVGEMLHAGTEMPIPRLSVPSPNRQTSGSIAAMALYAGQSVGAVKAIQPAGEIVRELADGAERLLRRWPAA
jgi:NAD(P)H-dependent flavin oxidoreductase YrpB (nitropropane dioxygenase family)